MRVAFATCSLMPDGWVDDQHAASLLGADFCAWDDPALDWDDYDRVVVRSVFDYTDRLDEFLAWCESVGERLRNPPGLVSFTADKRYLGELPVPTIPTTFVAPGQALPELEREFVVKPNVSAGARETGRFSAGSRTEALALLERIHAHGRTALVQPYVADVDARGETSLVYLGGELSHAVCKGSVLRPDEVAPVAEEGVARELGVAQAMLADDLVVPATAERDEIELADRLVAAMQARFGHSTYLRIDTVRGPDGAPAVMELEAIDPVLYLDLQPGASERFAAAIRAS